MTEQTDYGWPDHQHPRMHGGSVGGTVEDCRACLRCHLEAGYAAGFVEGRASASGDYCEDGQQP